MLGNNLVTSFAPHKGAFIYANLQHFFTFYSPSKSTYQNLQGGLSYFSKKLDIILGQNGMLRDPVLSNVGGQNSNGRGFTIAFRPTTKFTINSFYSQGPRLFNLNPDNISYGGSLGYHTLNNKFLTSAGYTQTLFFNALANQQDFMAGLRWKITDKHNFQGSIGLSYRQDSIGTTAQKSRLGVNWTAIYSGIYFDKKLTQNLTGVSRIFFNTADRSMQTLFLNSRTSLKLNNSSYFLQTGFIRTQNQSFNQNYTQIQIPTNFSFYIKNNLNFNFFPNFFHNYIADSLFRFNQVGLVFNNSYQNMNKNLRLSMNFRGTYNF
jgi:hypothetical protein